MVERRHAILDPFGSLHCYSAEQPEVVRDVLSDMELTGRMAAKLRGGEGGEG